MANGKKLRGLFAAHQQLVFRRHYSALWRFAAMNFELRTCVFSY
ncbi:hypothetical protein [Tunturibacter empetritectus]|nr:hypothetical protein [Edaphobacter lichenicola]